jgi:TRAP-type uncharacterized transport system substrate-binding protein
MVKLPRRPTQSTDLPLRDLAVTAAPFVLFALLLLALAFLVLKPNPPRRVVMATGAPLGAYHAFGLQYAERLKRHGITVELRNTEGAAENLALIRRPDSIARMQRSAWSRAPS